MWGAAEGTGRGPSIVIARRPARPACREGAAAVVIAITQVSSVARTATKASLVVDSASEKRPGTARVAGAIEWVAATIPHSTESPLIAIAIAVAVALTLALTLTLTVAFTVTVAVAVAARKVVIPAWRTTTVAGGRG